MPALLAPLLAVTWFARQNHFEWMFNPLPNADYARAGEAGFVADGDMVMAVEINGEAVPIPCARWLITTSLMTSSEASRSWRLTERSVTPVWCGNQKLTGRS